MAFLLLSWRRFPGVFSSGRVKDYVALTKPGISFMAAVTALAGFLLGSAGTLNGARLAHTALGTLLVSAGACALNMLLERDVDARMHRTESRPLPARRLYPGEALFLGVFLLSVGIVYLAGFVNGITAGVSGVTASIYLYVYTPLKKISALNTVFGAVAGALPPVRRDGPRRRGGLKSEPRCCSVFCFFGSSPTSSRSLGFTEQDYERRA